MKLEITPSMVNDQNLRERFVANNMNFAVVLQEGLKHVFSKNFQQAAETVKKGLSITKKDVFPGDIEPDLQEKSLLFFKTAPFLTAQPGTTIDNRKLSVAIFEQGMNYGEQFLAMNNVSPDVITIFLQMVYEAVTLYRDEKGYLQKATEFFIDGCRYVWKAIDRIGVNSESMTRILRLHWILSIMFWNEQETEKAEKLLDAGIELGESWIKEHNGIENISESTRQIFLMMIDEQMKRLSSSMGVSLEQLRTMNPEELLKMMKSKI